MKDQSDDHEWMLYHRKFNKIFIVYDEEREGQAFLSQYYLFIHSFIHSFILSVCLSVCLYIYL